MPDEPRSQTCVVVVAHDPDGSIAEGTDLVRCGQPVEREHGGWPMCSYHIAIFQPANDTTPILRIEDDNPVDLNQIVGELLYPNGRCQACGNGLDDEHQCQNQECSNYRFVLRRPLPELPELERIGYLCIQGHPNRICSGCTSACREPVFAYRESQTD